LLSFIAYIKISEGFEVVPSRSGTRGVTRRWVHPLGFPRPNFTGVKIGKTFTK
jgi:hypothetical protein